MRFQILAGLIAFVGGLVGVEAAVVTALAGNDHPTDIGAGAAMMPPVVTANTLFTSTTAPFDDDRPSDTGAALKPPVIIANTFLTSTVSDTDGGSTPSGATPYQIRSNIPGPLSCPRDNGTGWTVYSHPPPGSNQVFLLECGIDFYDPYSKKNHYVDSGMKDSWEECAKWCDTLNNCLAFSYIAEIPLKPNCWLKDSIEGRTPNSNSWGGRLVAIDGSPQGDRIPHHGDGDKSVALTTAIGPLKARATTVPANTLLTPTVSALDRGSPSVSIIPSSGGEPKFPILCPRDNNTYWIDHGRSRHAFKVQCGMDHYDPAHNWNFDKGMKNSWEECAMWCGEFDHCLGFSYIGGIPLKPNCWLKSNLSGEVENWNSWGGTWVGMSSYLDDHGDGDDSVTIDAPPKQTTTVEPVKIETTTKVVQDTAFTTAVTTVVTTELVKPVAPATTVQVAKTSGSLSTPILLDVTCTHDDWWADERAAWRAIEYFCEGGRDGTFGGEASDKILHEEDSFAAAYWPYNGTAVVTSVGSLPGCTIKLDKNLCMERFKSVMYGCDLDVRYQKRGGTVNDGCFAWAIHMQSWPGVGQCQDQDKDDMGLCAVWSTSYNPSDSNAHNGLKIDWFHRD